MERLTNKREADAQRKEYEKRISNGYPRNIPEERFLRLAAYEDTGLTPEQVEELAHDTTGPLHRKIGEWIGAEAAGRLVISPCKIGDRLYRVFAGAIFEHRVWSMKYFAMQGMWDIDTNPFCPYVESSIGKTIFLTREEAEAALKGKENGCG